jgi:hypothetical protein
LARTLASPCLGHEPKVRVATKLVPFIDHSSEGVTYAFSDIMLNRFGVLVEVFTDQGT